jgi:hypothetical protein
VLSWLRRADDEGLYEADWLQLGIPLPRLMVWRDEEKPIAATVVPEPVIPRPTDSTSLVPVAIRDDGLSPFMRSAPTKQARAPVPASRSPAAGHTSTAASTRLRRTLRRRNAHSRGSVSCTSSIALRATT